jgi:CheY-like chemotaxis protein
MNEKLGKTVLVIDDEPDVRLFFKTVLEDGGFDVMLAANGKEALERVTDRRPDVISLDLVMPKMSGLKFYKYIQKNPERADIPVVVITAHARDDFGQGDLAKLEAARPEHGVLLVLEKPVAPVPYLNTVRKALGLAEIGEGPAGDRDSALQAQVSERLRRAGREKLEEVLRVLSK